MNMPFSVVDANGCVLDQSASEGRARDRKWELEHGNQHLAEPLTITDSIPWDGHEEDASERQQQRQ